MSLGAKSIVQDILNHILMPLLQSVLFFFPKTTIVSPNLSPACTVTASDTLGTHAIHLVLSQACPAGRREDKSSCAPLKLGKNQGGISLEILSGLTLLEDQV